MFLFWFCDCLKAAQGQIFHSGGRRNAWRSARNDNINHNDDDDDHQQESRYNAFLVTEPTSPSQQSDRVATTTTCACSWTRQASPSSATKHIKIINKRPARKRPIPRYRAVRRSECPLLAACWDQDWQTVRQRCRQRPSEAFCKSIEHGRTALHFCTMPGTATCPSNILQVLLQINPHALLQEDTHRYGGTPLHFLCGSSKWRDDVNMMQLFVETAMKALQLYETCRVSLRVYGWSPLYVAARRLARTECIDLLLLTRRRPSKRKPRRPGWVDNDDDDSDPNQDVYTSARWIAPWTGGEMVQDMNCLPFECFCSPLQALWEAAASILAPLMCPGTTAPATAAATTTASPQYPVSWLQHHLYPRMRKAAELAIESYYEEISAPVSPHFKHWGGRLKAFLEFGRLIPAQQLQQQTAVTDISLDDEEQQSVQSFKHDEEELLQVWVRCLLLLRESVVSHLEEQQDPLDASTAATLVDVNVERPRWIMNAKQHRVAAPWVFVVATLYRPIPDLLRIMCILFPEQVSQPCWCANLTIPTPVPFAHHPSQFHGNNSSTEPLFDPPPVVADCDIDDCHLYLPLHAVLRRDAALECYRKNGMTWQLITPLVNAAPETLLMTDPSTGLLPFLLAATHEAPLTVIWYMLIQCPIALMHAQQATMQQASKVA